LVKQFVLLRQLAIEEPLKFDDHPLKNFRKIQLINIQELETFENSLNTELNKEKAKMESDFEKKRQNQEKGELAKKQQLEDELRAQIDSKSQYDQTKLLKEHQLKLDKIDEKRALDQKRMQDQIKKRLEDKKKNLVTEKITELEEESLEKEKSFIIENEKVDVEEMTKASKEVDDLTGPLTIEQMDKVLSELPVVNSLRNLERFLGKAFLDGEVNFGPIEYSNMESFDTQELVNYRYAQFILSLLQDKLKIGKNLVLKFSQSLPKGKDH
jgi:hypothetical protein